MEGKCVLDVADPHSISFDEHANDVEAIGVGRAAMAVDPDAGGTAQLPLLPPIHRFYRPAEPRAAPSLDLDERDHPIPLDHEIDVTVPRAEPSLHDTPSAPPKPPFRDPLPQLAECLPGR